MDLRYIPKNFSPGLHKYIFDYSLERKVSYMKGTIQRVLREPIQCITYQRVRDKSRIVGLLTHRTRALYRVKAFSKDKDNILHKNYSNHNKAMNAFFEAIGKEFLESEGGLFMEKIGYFTAELDQRLTDTNKYESNVYRMKLYTDIIRDGALQEMTMDRAWSENMRQEFSKRLFGGQPYYNLLELVKHEIK